MKSILFVITFLFTSATFCCADQDPNAKIGAILPLSGELASLGGKLRDGIVLAAEDHGAKAIFEDGALSKPQVLSAFQKLTTVDGVRFVVGPFGPDQTLALAPTVESSEALLVAVAMCEPRFVALKNVFCIFPKSAQQIGPLLSMLDDPSVRTVAYFGEELQGFEDYRNRIRSAVRDKQKSLVLDETFRTSDTDFRAILTRLHNTKVDVLAIAGAKVSSVVLAFRQARELGVSPKFRWFLSEHDNHVIKEHGKLLEGAYGLAVPQIEAKFSERFRKRFGYAPDIYSSLAYDGAASLLQGMKGAKELSAQAVSNILAGKQILKESATPGFRFDQDRTVVSDVRVTKIHDGAIGIE